LFTAALPRRLPLLAMTPELKVIVFSFSIFNFPFSIPLRHCEERSNPKQ
jgi:hypothetical protein